MMLKSKLKNIDTGVHIYNYSFIKMSKSTRVESRFVAARGLSEEEKKEQLLMDWDHSFQGDEKLELDGDG